MSNLLKNNFWYENNNSPTVYIFVHGFFSDSRKCWTSKDAIYWPDVICNDARLKSPSIFMAGYHTGIDSGDYKISDCADEVVAAIRIPSSDGEEPVILRKNIIFICHSLGGIVVRYMLEQHREIFKDKSIGVVLIASPSIGSDYATNLKMLALFYTNGIAAQLQKSNPSLVDLDERFKSLLEEKKIPQLVGAEAVEHHFIFHNKFLPGFSPVVKMDSAARYFGRATILPNTNHSTCVKPTSVDHPAHKFLVRFYLEKFQKIIHVEDVLPKKEILKISRMIPSSLFEIYNIQDEKYYISRKIDSIIDENIRQFSIWTFGISGSGKTSAVRRRAFHDSENSIHIYIGGAVDIDATHKILLLEIYYCLVVALELNSESFETTNQIITELASILVKNSKEENIFLVIDEIPFLNEKKEMTLFIKSISELITIAKQKKMNCNVRISLTSIFDPRPYFIPEMRKINEHIAFLEFNLWKDEELLSLMNVIESEFSTLSLSDNEKDHVMSNACGSPRYVKTFYKNYKINSKLKNAFLEAISMTNNVF